ncbi:hypothetical protein HDU98_009455 [Podochytrium sp. JEL0797]|nr:hypothetical protein HDU98_009455 [Podochytrium sp. JEL0797]
MSYSASSRSKNDDRGYAYGESPATHSGSRNRNVESDRARGYAGQPETAFEQTYPTEYVDTNSKMNKGSKSPQDVPMATFAAGNANQDYNYSNRNVSGPSRNQYIADEKWDSDNGRDVKAVGSDFTNEYAHDEYGGYPDDKPAWKSNVDKYLCCCCPKNKKHRMICGGVVLVVLIALAIPAYFYWPRFPEIKVISINVSNIEKGAFNFTTPGNNGNLNQMSISMDMMMNVSTMNPNLYGLTVDTIDLTAFMMVNKTYVYDRIRYTHSLTSFNSLRVAVDNTGLPPNAADIPAGSPRPSNSSQIGTAKVDGIYFPSNQWVNYTMMFHLVYTANPYTGLLEDPTVMEIADACGITSLYKPPGRPMRIHYEATTTISMLKPLGYAPSVSNDIMITCPIKQCQIEQIVHAAAGGASAMDALQSILSAPENC